MILQMNDFVNENYGLLQIPHNTVRTIIIQFVECATEFVEIQGKPWIYWILGIPQISPFSSIYQSRCVPQIENVFRLFFKSFLEKYYWLLDPILNSNPQEPICGIELLVCGLCEVPQMPPTSFHKLAFHKLWVCLAFQAVKNIRLDFYDKKGPVQKYWNPVECQQRGGEWFSVRKALPRQKSPIFNQSINSFIH